MKKSIFTTFAFAASLALVSCGGSAEKTESTQDSVAAPEATEAPAPEAKAEQPKEEEKVGPVELDLECFKVKVPEGWKVTKEKPGKFAMFAMEPVNKDEFKEKMTTNFGFEIKVNASASGKLENICGQAERQYKGVEKSNKTIGGLKYTVYHCDAAKTGGAGITDRLIAPLNEGGYIDVVVHSLGLDDPMVKDFLNSIVLLK